MELAVPTDRADDPDPRGKETLSLSLSLSLFLPALCKEGPPWTIKGRVIRLGKGHHCSTSRLIVHSHSKACNSLISYEHPGLSNTFNRPSTGCRA
jgi:hypothetical protein